MTPILPPSRCLEYGCPNKAIARGKCADHYVPWEQRSQSSDLTRSEREGFRTAVLSRDPICQHCGTNPSTEADHILPVALGGARTDPANGQGLCTPCHDRKTRSESSERARRRRKASNR